MAGLPNEGVLRTSADSAASSCQRIPAPERSGHSTDKQRVNDAAGGDGQQFQGRFAAGDSMLNRFCSRVPISGIISFMLLLHLSAFPAVSVAATAPGAPLIGPTSAGSHQVTVNFTPPVSDGGSPLSGYTVTSSPDALFAAGSRSPLTVTGLTNGRVYTFTVTATNEAGFTSVPSAPSNNTTPRLYAPTSGTLNNLVVFIRFSDQPEYTHPLSYYDGIFNAAPNSLKNYYLENSYNALTVNSSFYPVSGGTAVVSYQDSHPASYYRGSGPADREKLLVTNALEAIRAEIPAGLELDIDNDGYIDHITFEVYSTASDPIPSMFSSRATYDTSGSISLDINGKTLKVGSYTWITASQDIVYPDYSFATVEIHEMGHNFGYPDLRNNFNGWNPVGNWDIMSISFSPVHSGAYMKHKFTQWIPDIPVITAYDNYVLNDITQAAQNSYKINIPNSDEFLVLEYRPATGAFESHLPGKGLCITRVNEAAGFWGNMNGPPFFLYYFRPGGTYLSDGSAANLFTCLDPAAGQTQFNDYSSPACFLSDGRPCGISIYNIGQASATSISFSVGDPATTTVTHVIKGTITYGLSSNRVSGVTVTLSGDATGEMTTTTSSPSYLFTVNAGAAYTYTITPSKANVIFSPPSVTVSNLTSDRILNFSATKITRTISGKVTNSSGAPLGGIPVYIYCSVGENYVSSVQTDAAGLYSFIVDAGGTCEVDPRISNYFFKPLFATFTNITADQTQNFTTNPGTVTLSGIISSAGIPLSGVEVSCPGAATTPVTTGGSGAYSFVVTVGNGALYTVTPSSAAYKFSPVSISYPGLFRSENQNFTAIPKAGSTTVLESSLNPSILGQGVTVTATVSGSSPTGTVTFTDGPGTACAAVALSGGQASCGMNSLAAGIHSIVAVYSGDGDNAGSSSVVLQQVVKLPLPTISATPDSTATVGQPYGFWIWTTGTTSITISGGTPQGLTVSATDSPDIWSLDWTPAAAGLYSNIILTAHNNDGSADLPAFSVTVKYPMPTMAGHPATIGMVGIPYSTFTPAPCAPPAPSTCNATSFSLSGGLPPGLDFNTDSGVISGIPTTAGSYRNLVVTAINPSGSAALSVFTIRVSPALDRVHPGSSMTTARQYYTATLLADGRVLAVGGVDSTYLPLAGAERYNPATGIWSPAGALTEARSGHTANLLQDGRVLVAGGTGNASLLGTAEIYDPVSNSWSAATGSMSVARDSHAATLLSDGRLLVTGGFDADYDLSSVVELYDPVSKLWLTVEPMLDTRYGNTMTLLPDGRVLAAGGSFLTCSAELYDASEDLWSPAAEMQVPRFAHTATVLLSGQVLAAGGYDLDGNIIAGAELYDPATDSWRVVGSMNTVRQAHTAALLTDGSVLVVGGTDYSSFVAFAELYDPVTETWSIAGLVSTARSGYSVVALTDGSLLILGGHDGTSVISGMERYAAPRILTLSRSGNGTVTVDGASVLWAADTWFKAYDPAVSVGLQATPDRCYTFGGWGGDYQSGSAVMLLDMKRDWTLSVTFRPNLPVYNATEQKDYPSLAAAAQAAADDDTLLLQAGVFDEILQIDTVGLSITGGVDCTYQPQDTTSAIAGLIISNGSVVLERIILQ